MVVDRSPKKSRGCARCGEVFLPACGPQKYCLICRKAVESARQQAAYLRRVGRPVRQKGQEVSCEMCSSSFRCGGGGDLYCEACTPLAARQRTRERHRKEMDALGVIPLGAMMTCGRCGGETPRANGRQKNCPACREQIAKEDAPRRHARYLAKHGDILNARKRERRRQDVQYALESRLSVAVRRSLRERAKSMRPWESLVGFSAQQLKDHIERQFLPGMSWDRLDEIHIDHILPLAMFDYETPEDPDFKVAWALTNLRPLWAKDNVQKHARRLHLL